MKKLNKNQTVAVFVGVAFVAYLLFGGSIMGFFNNDQSAPNTEENMDLPESGVVTKDITVGTGAEAHAGDAVAVHYVGTLPDGKVFDSSVDRGQPFVFQLGVGQVIRGWDEGVQGMKVGGKRLIVIAPDYAYGQQGVGTVPPNATLIFEVELLDVGQIPAQGAAN